MTFRECPEHGPIGEKLIWDDEKPDQCPIITTSWGEHCEKPLGPPMEMIEKTDIERNRQMNDAQRIERAGGIVTIGIECFALKDGSILSWRGENYVPQKPSILVRFNNWRVKRQNKRCA